MFLLYVIQQRPTMSQIAGMQQQRMNAAIFQGQQRLGFAQWQQQAAAQRNFLLAQAASNFPTTGFISSANQNPFMSANRGNAGINPRQNFNRGQDFNPAQGINARQGVNPNGGFNLEGAVVQAGGQVPRVIPGLGQQLPVPNVFKGNGGAQAGVGVNGALAVPGEIKLNGNGDEIVLYKAGNKTSNKIFIGKWMDSKDLLNSNNPMLVAAAQQAIRQANGTEEEIIHPVDIKTNGKMIGAFRHDGKNLKVCIGEWVSDEKINDKDIRAKVSSSALLANKLGLTVKSDGSLVKFRPGEDPLEYTIRNNGDLICKGEAADEDKGKRGTPIIIYRFTGINNPPKPFIEVKARDGNIVEDKLKDNPPGREWLRELKIVTDKNPVPGLGNNTYYFVTKKKITVFDPTTGKWGNPPKLNTDVVDGLHEDGTFSLQHKFIAGPLAIAGLGLTQEEAIAIELPTGNFFVVDKEGKKYQIIKKDGTLDGNLKEIGGNDVYKQHANRILQARK